MFLKSPSNLNLPCLSFISPSLAVQIFLYKWSNRVPQDQRLLISASMAAVAMLSVLLFSKRYHYMVNTRLV